MRVLPVTARYTEALFRLAQKKGVLEDVTADVQRMAKELHSPSVREFLVSPRVTREEKGKRLAPLLEGMHEYTQNFVNMLLDRSRERVLIELPTAFHRRQLEERGGAEGYVESPRPLEAGDVGELAAALTKQLGREVQLESRVVPDLIGGVRVVVENRMIDYTVQGRLGALHRKMLEAPLPGAVS